MEEYLRAKMLATASITAIVGARIDWEVRPQGDAYPAIELNLISDIPAPRMGGGSTWHDARVQADCWGRTPGHAILARRAIVTAMHCLRDEAGDPAKKYRVFVIDGDDRAETDAIGIVHRARVDLRISYQT